MGIYKMNQKFTEMNLQELRDYVLKNTGDREAFYIYVDRSKSERNWSETMPPLQSVEDLDLYPEFLVKLSRDGANKGN